jgi:acyl-CoA thioester hydrolase
VRHDSGEIAAGFQLLVSHVTVRDHRAFPWPQRVRDRAEALKMEIPERAQPRSVALDGPLGEASLARAEALGLTKIAQGAVLPQHCDTFGRMRADHFMGRISDGIARLGATGLDLEEEGAADRGGAALEYRLAHLAWPRAGDRVALYSGLAGVEPRIRRYVHWLVDPETGQAWGVAQSTGVSLDLRTRKLIENTPEKLERFKAFVIPGLAF